MTIKDVAEKSGVSVSTVSRVLNDHPDVSEKVRNRVMAVVNELHYVPNNSAQNLKRVESNTIALLTKGVGNPLFAEMIQTVQSDVLGKDYLFVLQQVDEMENELEVGARLANEKRLKGIIFMGGASRPKEELLRRIDVPYVICTVDAVMPENMENYGIVAIDDEAESYRMIDYLCRLGHRKIAIITAYAHDTSIGKLRLDGYRRALADNGIECEESLVVHMPAKGQVYTMKNGYDQTMKLLQSGAKFTAIYAISDTLAIGACKAIFDYGLRVPDDISVVGCDGLDMARYYQPAITTIEQPLSAMALETSRILFELIREKGGKKKHIFEARIREGQSVRRI